MGGVGPGAVQLRAGRAAARPAAVPGSPGRLPFVEANLAPPVLRDGLVPRDTLLRTLLGTQGGRLVSLVAPAGYGKTTVLVQWRARERRPVAWASVEVADADPIRLLTTIAHAVDRATGLDPAVFDLLTTSGVSPLSTVVPRLSSDLYRRDPRLVLMIDDVHRIAGTPSVDVLSMLIDYLPAGVVVAVAGRTDGGLPLARVRAGGRLVEIGPADLALDEDETVRMLGLLGHHPSPDEARRLRARTEGWPAALYLATRGAPRGGRDATEAVLRVSGDDLEIGAYLDAELLDRTAPETMTFLMRTAILERMTSDLCDAVVRGTGSGAILRDLATTNQLVVPLDTEGEWYRCHALLREHLGGLLARESVDATILHRRAAEWFAANDMADEAIDHLLAAGDPDAAAAAISAVALRTYRGGRTGTLERWLRQLDDTWLRRHPFLAAMTAWSDLLRGRWQDLDRLADLMAASGYEGERPDGAQSFEAARALVGALMARTGLADAVEEAELAVAIEPGSGPWRPICLVVLGGVLGAAGDGDRADELLGEAIATAEAIGADRAHVAGVAWRALLATERDDWMTAAELTRQGLASVAHYSHEADMTVASMMAVAARVAIHFGDPAAAHRHLAGFHAAKTALSVGTPWLSVQCLVAASRAHLALADPAGARTLLRQAEDIMVRRPDLGRLRAEVANLRARIRDLPPGPGGASTLTPAEVRVLRLLPTYLSAPEIAERLFVAPNTVRTQIRAVYGKLGAASRAEAVERGIEAGLLEPLPVLSRGIITSP